MIAMPCFLFAVDICQEREWRVLHSAQPCNIHPLLDGSLGGATASSAQPLRSRDKKVAHDAKIRCLENDTKCLFHVIGKRLAQRIPSFGGDFSAGLKGVCACFKQRAVQERNKDWNGIFDI